MSVPRHRREELAAFLRKRREAIRPEDVELPSSGRRRTPGLRREEVAALAGVGVTWYTWLEQARDINVSAEVLDAIARALRLDQRERTHLFTLSARVDVDNDVSCAAMAPGHDLLLRQLEPFPAATFSWRYDVIAYNHAYRMLCCDLDEVPVEERNLLWLTFTHPAWAGFSADRATVGRHMVAKFRIALARHLGDPMAQELIGRLRHASADFAGIWDRTEVATDPIDVKVLNSSVGVLRVHGQRLLHSDNGDSWTMVYVPADEATAAAVQRLGRAEHDDVTSRLSA